MKWEGKDKGGAGCYGQALFDLPIRRIIIFRYNISYGELPDGLDFSGSDEESIPPENGNGSGGQAQRSSSSSVRRKMSASSRRSSSFNISQEKVTCYRWVSWHRGGLSQGGHNYIKLRRQEALCLMPRNERGLDPFTPVPYLLRPPWLASRESFYNDKHFFPPGSVPLDRTQTSAYGTLLKIPWGSQKVIAIRRLQVPLVISTRCQIPIRWLQRTLAFSCCSLTQPRLSEQRGLTIGKVRFLKIRQHSIVQPTLACHVYK